MFVLVYIKSFRETKLHELICLTVPSVWPLNCLSSPLSFRVYVKTFPTWLTHSIRYKEFTDVNSFLISLYFFRHCGSASIALEFRIFVCFGSTPLSSHPLVPVCIAVVPMLPSVYVSSNDAMFTSIIYECRLLVFSRPPSSPHITCVRFSVAYSPCYLLCLFVMIVTDLVETWVEKP